VLARHPGQRTGAGAAGQAEQDGLGLVVEGVAEQDHRRAQPVGGRVQGGVARVAGGGFRPPLTADLDRLDLDRVQTQLGAALRDCSGAFG
jgi:hypothetical protein